MSISLQNHDDRISLLENAKIEVKEIKSFVSTPTKVPTSGVLYIDDFNTELGYDFIIITFSCDYGSDDIYAKNPAVTTMFWPVYFLDGWYAYYSDWYGSHTYDGSKFDFAINPNGSSKQVLRVTFNSNATPNTWVKECYGVKLGLKLYYNFSYNIYSLISHFWNNFITKEVQEVKMSISLKSLYDQVQSISLSGVKNIHKATNGYVEFYNGLTINWGISGPGLPPGSGSQWKSYSWVKPFTNACVAVTTGDISGNYSGSNNPINLRSVSKTGVQILQFDNFKCYWIAIGYLISDRILKYIIYAVDFLASLINWRCKISMAISLKALYDQVQAIKTSQSTWTTGSGTNGRWWKESSTGLIIQAGEHYHPEVGGEHLVFPTPFSINTYGFSACCLSDTYVTCFDKTNSQLGIDTSGVRNDTIKWLAIGYLISNRIKEVA